jgi:hypothetical protein
MGKGKGVAPEAAAPAVLDLKSWMPFVTFTDQERFAEQALASKTAFAEVRLASALLPAALQHRRVVSSRALRRHCTQPPIRLRSENPMGAAPC